VTLLEAKRRVRELAREAAANPDIAHQIEEALYRDFVLWVARGGKLNLVSIACVLRGTQKMVFKRL